MSGLLKEMKEGRRRGRRGEKVLKVIIILPSTSLPFRDTLVETKRGGGKSFLRKREREGEGRAAGESADLSLSPNNTVLLVKYIYLVRRLRARPRRGGRRRRERNKSVASRAAFSTIVSITFFLSKVDWLITGKEILPRKGERGESSAPFNLHPYLLYLDHRLVGERD